MFASLTKLLGGNKPTPAARATTAFRPAVEELGDRIVPAGAYLSLPSGSSSGVLNIDGTNGGDTVRVSYVGSSVQVDIDNINYHRQFSQSSVAYINFRGYGGGDTYANDTNIGSYAYGGDGNDTLWGGGSWDVLYGENGNDVLAGRAGDDTLYGGGGYDKLYGGYYECVYQSGWNGYDGFDRLDGGYDNITDYLYGGTGTDYFYQHYYSGWFSNSYQYELIVDYSYQDAVSWIAH